MVNNTLMPGIRTLIIDDSPVMRKIVERSLREAGIVSSALFEAGDGAEALALLAENQVDLILCDNNMPVMNGLQFLRQLDLEQSPRAAPVVMITTEAGESDVMLALSAGAQGYIRKPFTTEQVQEVLLPLLRVYAADSQPR